MEQISNIKLKKSFLEKRYVVVVKYTLNELDEEQILE